ncbi:glycerophosphodiester phosphodiesterase family protein [Sphingobium sp. AN558]
MAAFDAAIAAGFGIECDVRLSRDGEAIIYHDETLTRLLGSAGRVADLTAAELDAMPLPDGAAPPRFAALLARCGRATPLLVEIKVDGWRVTPLCKAIAADLGRNGDAPAAVMSFNPLAVRWFARHAPKVTRGLVVTQQGKGNWRGRLSRALALWLARPDFLACDIRDLPSPFACAFRRRGLPVLTWTVRNAQDRRTAADHADQIIFEHGHD